MELNNIFYFKYHTIFVLFIHSLIYISESIFSFGFSNDWLVKCIGTLTGYFFSDIFINLHSLQYNLYIKNFIKYISIFISQNIISKLLINNFIVLNSLNIIKINLYLLIYFFIDIIINAIIDDQNNNKEMYLDLVKTGFGFIIIESLLKRKFENNDYVYITIICIGLFIFYNFIDKYIKESEKKKKEK